MASSTGKIAGDVKTYVDDKRPTGQTYLHCRQVARQTAAFLGYLWMQDASRKREEPSLRAGAWSGIVCHTDAGAVSVLCTQEKWDKARGYIAQLMEQQAHNNIFNHKELERIRGFLVYVIRTYPSFTPFLKGIHLTLDSWRPNRGEDGWKVILDMHQHLGLECSAATYPSTPPPFVTGVPRLKSDLQALHQLLSPPNPPRRVIRSTQVMIVIYGYGDASGHGFGSTFYTPTGLKYRYGLWGRDASHQSSNFRELANLVQAASLELQDTFPNLTLLVDSVSSQIISDHSQSTELFLFTDNIVAEGAFYKGTSSNPLLFELIVHLWQLETHYSLTLHVVHVSGQRMQAQGMDGLSRGNLDIGTLRGEQFLDFVPLHLDALQHSTNLIPWIQSWSPGLHLLPLTPLDWFRRGQGIIGDDFNSDGVWIPKTSCRRSRS